MRIALLDRWIPRPKSRTQTAHPDPQRRRWRLERLEDRAVPAVAYATAQGAGGPAASTQVLVFSETGALIATIDEVYPGFTGGLRVATGDVNNDGVPDVVTGAGAGGGPHVKVFDGAGLQTGITRTLREFFAYDFLFGGGVNVGVGDVNGDGLGDVITGAGPSGGPHVKAFSGADGTTLLANFFAYDVNFPGGVNVAAADVGGDNGGSAGGRGNAEIVTGAGPGSPVTVNGITFPGGGPHVKVFDVPSPGVVEEIVSFMAFDVNFNGGVFVAAGFTSNNRDSDNFQYADIVVSAGAFPGTGAAVGPTVRSYRLLDGDVIPWSYNLVAEFQPYGPAFQGGVRVAVTDLNGDGQEDFVTTPGLTGGPHLVASAGQSVQDFQTFNPAGIFQNFVYAPEFTGGVFVG
jgi:hypothetical protein